MLHLSRHLWAPAVLLIFTTAVRAQDAPQPAGTTQPAAQDLSAEALAPKVPAAPKSDEEIVSRLELLDTELQRLGPTTQPSTAPATGPADRLASARWRLGQVLQQYRSGLDRWRQARIDIAALKSPKQSDQLAADLDRWSRQQKRIEEQRQDLARHAWRAQTLLDQAEKNKEHEDLAAELRRMEALQTARESQLTALAARQTETKTAIDKTLADLKAYAAGLPAKAAEAATPEDRAVLLTEKRILEWQHGLQLLRAGSWSDLNLHLEIPLRQDGDRVKVLRELVNAIQQYRDAIHKIVTGDTIAQARENLARPDLPDYERTYWQIRLTLLQAVADFQAYRQFIEDTRLQTQEFDPDRLGQQIARGRWYLDEFLESLDRRSGQIIIEIHRTLGERLAVNEDRLRTVRTHLDLMADKLRAAQDRKDETATRVLLGQTRLEDEIKQLEGDQLAQARDLQTRLTTEVNKSIKEEIDAVVTELAALHDRFDKLVPVLTDHIKRLRVARSALYWRRLTVAGRSLFDQDWSGLLAEVRAVASGQGEMGQRVRSQCDLLTRQWREVPLQRHLAVAVLVLLSILLGRRARSRLRAWLEASDEAIEMARQEAQEGGRAFELGPAFRLQIQSARAAAHASLILWPLVTLVLYGLWLRSEGLTFPLLSMVLGLVAVALAGPPLVSAIFDSKRPHLRVIRCDDPVARFHRWWLKSLGLAALVLLPWPLMLDQLGVTAILRRVVSEVGLTAFLLLSLLYLVRRSRFVALLAPTNGQPGLLAGFLVRLYLLLPLFVAVMIGLQVAGYAALAKYMAQGIGLSLLIALAGKVASALLAAWAGLIEKFITSHMSHAAREAEAPPPHPLWRFLAQVTRLGVFVAAVAGILAVWGISLVELHQLANYSLLTTEHGALTIARILWAVLAVVAGVLVSRTIRAFLRTEVFPQTRHVDLGTQAAICTLLHYAILALAFYIGLQILFVSLGALTILLGTLGLGLGLGLQPLFVNFISGLMILFERQVKVGDVIELADKTPCEVLSISMRSTQIRTPDNIDHVIPNGEFINGRVVNWTLTDTRLRARMQIGVAYGSDPQLVRKILLDVAHRHPDVLVDPAPEVWFVEFGDNALIFVLAVWFPNAAARWRFLSQVRFELTDLFKQHNIEIPFPQRTLSVIGDKPLPVEIRGPDRPAPQEPKPTAP